LVTSQILHLTIEKDTNWNYTTNDGMKERTAREGVNWRSRKYFFMGNSVNRHYSFALEKLMKGQRDGHADRSSEKAECPKDTLGCDRGQVKFLWKNWPLVPRRTPTMPQQHLSDGCHGYPSLQSCLEVFFANATSEDVLIIGSNYAFTSICQFGTEEQAYATARIDIPESIESVLQLFPGIILYHSLGPVRPDHPRPDEHQWIATINNITKQAVANTRIVFVDSYEFLLDKTSQFDDVIHHSGPPSEGVVSLFLETIATQGLDILQTRRKYAPRCRDWASEYVTFHRGALQAFHRDPVHALDVLGIKILIFKPDLRFNQGFADRIAGLQKAFLLAFCSRRLFLVDWPAIQGLFEDGDIVWKYPNRTFAALNARFAVEYIHNEYDKTSMSDYISLLTEKGSQSLISIHFNRAASAETLQNTECGNLLKSMGLSENNLFACTMRLLLQPKDEILLAYSDIARAIQNTEHSVGIHIRFGDRVWRPGGHNLPIDMEGMMLNITRRIQCFKPYLSEDSLRQDRFFLLTDNVEFKRRITELYPSKVYATTISPKHVAYSASQNEYAEVVAEWYLFSLTAFHVIDGGSGLGRTSYAYSFPDYPSFYLREADCVPRWPKDLVKDGAKLR
jgi:hypothetical protein